MLFVNSGLAREKWDISSACTVDGKLIKLNLFCLIC